MRLLEAILIPVAGLTLMLLIYAIFRIIDHFHPFMDRLDGD